MCNFYFHILHSLHRQERPRPIFHQLRCLFAFQLCQSPRSHLFPHPHPLGSMRASGRGMGCRGQLLHVASKTHLQDQHTESRCPDWGAGGVNDCIPPFTICLLERCGVLRRTLGVASKKTHIFLAISCTSLSLSFLINEIKTLTQDLAS